MKYVSFKPADSDEPSRIGVVLNGGSWLDLNRACRAMYMANGSSEAAGIRIANALIPGNMVDFIESGDACRQISGEVVTWYEAHADQDHLMVNQGRVKLLPPIPRPPMLRDFMGFETHLLNIYPKLGRAIPPEWYELPVYYKGNPGSLGANGDDVRIPGYAQELDYEFELGMVIGKPGIDIPRDRAMEHVFGFTIYNDFSARKIQGQEMAVGLGPAKGKDFTGGHIFGPCLVTLDEVGDPYSLGMRAYVNDKLVCDDSSATMHWKFEDMIAHASKSECLVVGEIFGSGTVGNGSGGERDLALHPGDTTRLEVDRLGTLTNRIVG